MHSSFIVACKINALIIFVRQAHSNTVEVAGGLGGTHVPS